MFLSVNMKMLLIILLIFVSIEKFQGKILSRQISSLDEERISFAENRLKEYFRNENGINPLAIGQIQSFINEKSLHQLWTINFEVLSLKDEIIYECPISIYENREGNLRFLLRSIVCLMKLKRNEKIFYPIEKEMFLQIEQFDDENSMKFDENLFSRFEEIYQKSYRNEKERENRLKIFQENLNRIEKLNWNEDGSAVYGITHLTDLNEEEFQRFYLNEKLSSKISIQSQIDLNPFQIDPTEFDWRNFSAVTDVKNQGQCGSCWAFSVTGNIEGVWKNRRGQLIPLSEQELVDCDHVDEGCNGGFMTTAFDQIIQMKGLMSEDDYKYDGKQHQQCQLDQTKIRVQINSYFNISTDENEIAQWLAANAPISIGLNANMMQFYFRGVAHPHRTFCNPQGINHGVLLVGYGIEEKRSKSIPFWIIKNSWGNHWGEKGYYRLYRGDGSCGVNLMCSSAIVN